MYVVRINLILYDKNKKVLKDQNGIEMDVILNYLVEDDEGYEKNLMIGEIIAQQFIDSKNLTPCDYIINELFSEEGGQWIEPYYEYIKP